MLTFFSLRTPFLQDFFTNCIWHKNVPVAPEMTTSAESQRASCTFWHESVSVANVRFKKTDLFHNHYGNRACRRMSIDILKWCVNFIIFAENWALRPVEQPYEKVYLQNPTVHQNVLNIRASLCPSICSINSRKDQEEEEEEDVELVSLCFTFSV